MAKHHPSPESALHFPYGNSLPAPGECLEVASGVHWLRMPLPFALDHINLWLLRDHLDGVEGWTIVDCGIANDATRDIWARIFETQLQGLPVLRVIVTHLHPDHVGLAHWLTTQWERDGRSCRLWMSASDYHAARLASDSRSGTTGVGGSRAAQFFAQHGLQGEDNLAKIEARSGYYASMVPQVPSNYRRLMDGDKLTIGSHRWQTIAGYGHAPEHMALYSPGLDTLISGDMVLPRISTNISVTDIEPEADPLSLYLASLARFDALPASTLVLPSHGRPFIGLPTRLTQLREHHAARLSQVMSACEAHPCSAADLLPVLFKPGLDLHQTTFAMGEAVAHLNHLWRAGQLQRITDDDGGRRFKT